MTGPHITTTTRIYVRETCTAYSDGKDLNLCVIKQDGRVVPVKLAPDPDGSIGFPVEIGDIIQTTRVDPSCEATVNIGVSHE